MTTVLSSTAPPATADAAPPFAPDPATGLHSALYEGEVLHARTDATPTAFRYRVLMGYLDLAELPGALDAHPLWSARHPAPMRFRRQDFHGDPDVPLDQAIRDTVATELGHRPTGPIRMLAHLRTWGWAFNPIAFSFVFTPDGSAVEALVAEVTNTPWHERHAYVVPVGADRIDQPVRFPKQLHVSPFLDMDLDHTLAFSRPGEPNWTIRMDDRRGEHQEFTATLRLRRLPLDRPTMGAALRRHPLPAHRVSAGIYWEALKLRLRGGPFRTHPAKAGCTHRSSSATPAANPRDRP